MDYLDNIAKGLEVSYIDLLERIKEKYGEEEFVLNAANLKALRRNRWQTSATKSDVKLAPSIFAAIEKMAELDDPCIKILDSSNKKFRLLKLPALRGKAAVRAIPKETIVEENVALRAEIERFKAKVAEQEEALEKQKEVLEKERQSVEYYKRKAGEQVPVVDEDFSQLPVCYKTNDFSTWLPAFQDDKNGSRPPFTAKGYWEKVIKKLKFVDTWVTFEAKRFSEKLSASIRAKMDAGKIAAKASKVAPALRTTISQYFRFIAMTNGLTKSELKPDKQHLLSTLSLSAYLAFYSQYTKSPKTVQNTAKMLTSLFKFMLTLGEFHNQITKINGIIRTLQDASKQKKQQSIDHRARHHLESQMSLRGQWLNHIELSEVNRIISEEMIAFLDKFEKATPTKKEVFEFQCALILFCFLQTGGQRREVIVGFQIDNFALCGDNVVHFTLQEKVQKRKTDRLTLPSTLGDLLRIWIEKYRPILCPQPSIVTQCFVGYKGRPMEPKQFTAVVTNKIEEVMPGRHIGPLSIRTIMVTEMLHAASKNPGEFFQWAARHAALINTSKSMAETVYNCGNEAQQAQQTLATINTTFNLNPSQQLASTVKHHAAKVTYLTNKGEEIAEVVGRRWLQGDLQYQCKLTNGELSWHDYGTLVGITPLVHAFLKAESLKKRGIQPQPAQPAQPAQQAQPAQPAQSDQPGQPEPQQAEQDQPVPPQAQQQLIEQELPALETDLSDSDSDCEDMESDCNSEIDYCDVEAFSDGEDSDSDDSMDQDIEQAASLVAPETSRKRKRSDSLASPALSCNSPEPARKRHKSVYEAVKLDNRRIAKPGDIISVNPPKRAKEKFWLAKVVSVSTKRKVLVQWLDRVKPNQYKLLNAQDDVYVAAINKVASGTWTDSKIFKLGKV